MRGYPTTLNTKHDYEYVKENFPKEMWVQDFKNLLNTVFDWFYVKKLESFDEGVEDSTHKIVCNENDGNVEYLQYELRKNPHCKLFNLGYTEQEIIKLIGD